ncbi:xylose isomerase-like TIM barrel family protein [Burkholderia pseudomallei]|nr:xylose isomerase-like TIM barrel family protein [Burkholderia pseudomallei]CAJ4706829.1 xylose isomerase-like TIM barrel family protein [Burkholderia pseudomallei]CAJ5419551.1 xylose isomerase-like TIM barrel family protein [Burkholderia pseudomallei]CAJ7316593.1 xylose isomerase-like TIM barrel family protein [Burkholderia pseudomallei]
MSDSVSIAKYMHRDCLHCPAPLVGTSFKPCHFADIVDNGLQDGFFEVHAENYMGKGGPPHRALSALRETYPVSVHSVCLSIGGPSPLDAHHLARFRDVVARYEPVLVSEHLAWSSHGGAFYNDLLPLPYTKATLDRVCAHVDQIQEAIARPLLLENPSTYVGFASSTMSETEFIAAVAGRTGCGLLLDINNAFVSATNHGCSAADYLADFPLEQVGEIHLAGHSEQRDDEDEPLLIDSHDRPVAGPVWALYASVIARTGPVPTLVEWDSQLPDWPVLRAQALEARRIMDAAVASPVEVADHAL